MKDSLIHILIVDDQKLFSYSLKQVLQLETNESMLIETCSSAREAVSLQKSRNFDLLLMDVHMPEMNGIDAVKSIRSFDENVKILMLSAYGYDEYVNEALFLGADGYLLKDMSPEEVVGAIHGVIGGNLLMVPQTYGKVYYKEKPSLKEQTANLWESDLTEKEMKILVLLAKGYSNSEIAEDVFIGKQTVRNYISTIYSKMNVKDRFEAIRTAIDANIIERFSHPL